MSYANYEEVDLDPDKSFDEYNWVERRAFLYEKMKEKGYLDKPYRVYADNFDVSNKQISKDVQKINEFIVKNMDEDTLKGETAKVVEKALKNLIDKGEDWKAIKGADKKIDIAHKLGLIEKEPEKHKVEEEITLKVGSADSE